MTQRTKNKWTTCSLNPDWTSLCHKSLRQHHFFVINTCAAFYAKHYCQSACRLCQMTISFFNSNVGGKTMQTIHITYLYIHIGVLRNTCADIDLSPLYEKPPLLWLWSNAREKRGKMGEDGGGVCGVWTDIPRKVWCFTWATPVTVIATPSAVSTSSHLGCRVIISSVILWKMWKNKK